MANAVAELAKTGRSRCAMTGEVIEKGSPRVGFEIWRVGRKCMTYQNPKSFLSRLAVAEAQDSRSKCKFTGAPIKTGELVVTFTSGGAKGETPTVQHCSLSSVAMFLGKVSHLAGKVLQARDLVGFKSLSKAQQVSATKLLSTAGTAAGSQSEGSKKRPAAATQGASKRSRQ